LPVTKGEGTTSGKKKTGRFCPKQADRQWPKKKPKDVVKRVGLEKGFALRWGGEKQRGKHGAKESPHRRRFVGKLTPWTAGWEKNVKGGPYGNTKKRGETSGKTNLTSAT